MASSNASTVEEYLDELAEDRCEAISTVRNVIVANLPAGYVEHMEWGMITYSVPLETYPDTYNKKPLQYAALASQKNHMAVYLSAVYGNPDVEDWFVEEYKASGKKLDMGKSCVRFKKLEQLPVDLIGETIARVPLDDFLATYEAVQAEQKKLKAQQKAAKKAANK